VASNGDGDFPSLTRANRAFYVLLRTVACVPFDLNSRGDVVFPVIKTLSKQKLFSNPLVLRNFGWPIQLLCMGSSCMLYTWKFHPCCTQRVKIKKKNNNVHNNKVDQFRHFGQHSEQFVVHDDSGKGCFDSNHYVASFQKSQWLFQKHLQISSTFEKIIIPVI